MQRIDSYLNCAQKQAVLSKTQACICSMQLIHSLTCQTADSAFTDVCCLILLFVYFVFNHLTLPVICFVTLSICSPPTPFPSLYKNICRKWENIHKSISYYPNRILSFLLSKCHPALIWEPSQLPNTFEAWKREATQAVRNSFVFKGINPPNLRHATFLSKIKLQMFKNQD